jgi:hypothetical protein
MYIQVHGVLDIIVLEVPPDKLKLKLKRFVTRTASFSKFYRLGTIHWNVLKNKGSVYPL